MRNVAAWLRQFPPKILAEVELRPSGRSKLRRANDGEWQGTRPLPSRLYSREFALYELDDGSGDSLLRQPPTAWPRSGLRLKLGEAVPR